MKRTKKATPLYNIGDWVRVVSTERRYLSYAYMFKKMKFNTSTMKIIGDYYYNPVKLTYGKIFAVEMHEKGERGYLYGIECGGKQMLIGEVGITATAYTQIPEEECIKEKGGKQNSSVARFRQITEDMADLYERKNKDYGNSFSKGIERRGFGSAVDRLYDKVDRLNQLLVEQESAKVKDESVIDTLKDLANYAIMTVIEVEKRENK